MAGSAEDDLRAEQAYIVIGASASRGLEFDAVVVVDPQAIIDQLPAPRGARLLYVALTRPTRHLSVISPGPLPDFSGSPAGSVGHDRPGSAGR